MPFEIIRRKEGERSQKQEIRHKNTQFSLNSYGHLSIREFNDAENKRACEIGGLSKCKEPICCEECEHYKWRNFAGEEHLLVLDAKTTEGLIKFIFENRSTFEFKQLLKELIKNSKELPF